jgi:hypothetical protein
VGESKGRGVSGGLLLDRGGRFGSVGPQGGSDKGPLGVCLAKLALLTAKGAFLLPLFGASLVDFVIDVLKVFEINNEIEQ